MAECSCGFSTARQFWRTDVSHWLKSLLPGFLGKVPQAGERWAFCSDKKDPWECAMPRQTVTILDCKSNWGRYSFDGTSMWKDQRMKLSSFRFCYEIDGTGEQ